MKVVAIILIIILIIAGGFVVLSQTGYVDTEQKVTLKLDNSRTQGTATFVVTYTLSGYHIDGNIKTITKVIPYNADGGISIVVLPSDTTSIDIQGTLGGNVRTTGVTGLHSGAIFSVWYEANNVLVSQATDGVV